jgi:antitoxin HigA-1
MNRQPTHPGAVLREDVLPELGIIISEFARKLRVSRQIMHKVLSETSPVTPNIALRLGKFIGNGAGIWLRMQDAYDLWETEQKINKDLRKIKQYKEETTLAI